MLTGRARVVPRLPPLPAGQGARAGRAARWPGTTCSRPVGASTAVWDCDEAADFIVDAVRHLFARKMSDFAARAFRERWIDAEPRPGKTDGALLHVGLRRDESRILANFKPAFGGVSTLAHELGHGYHNLNLAGRTMLQRDTPMTLAETASIFCETIIRQAGLRAGRRRRSSSPSWKRRCRAPARSWWTSPAASCSSRRVFDGAAAARAVGGRAQRADAGRAAADLRRRPGPGTRCTPICGRPRATTTAPTRSTTIPYMFGLLFGLGLYARYQAGPGRLQRRLRRPAVVDRAGRRGRPWPRASASTSARPTSGGPAWP